MNERVYNQSPDNLRSKDRRERLEINKVVDYCLKNGKIKNVLDVGCGSGLFAEEFFKRGLKVTGIDLNPDMIEVAWQYLPEGNFYVGEAENLPFEDNSFDMVFFGVVLHEVNDYLKSLSEAYRICKIKTVVLEWKYEVAEFGPPIEHRLTEKFIEEAAKAAGFRNVESEHLTHLVLYTFEK
ncbi:MAG: class I SAM-dependent methyltransferase [Ignavibacteria bacterium]